MQCEELERSIGQVVQSLAPVGPLTAELIPLVGDETGLSQAEAQSPSSRNQQCEGPWDVALDVCLPLARILNRSADELARELAARLEKELALTVYPLRGYVNIRLPESCLWGPALPRECPLTGSAEGSISKSGGSPKETHLVVVPAPWRGASGMQYLRFVMGPLLQAVMLSKSENQQSRGEIVIACGEKEFPLPLKADFSGLVSYVHGRALVGGAREEDLSISEQIARVSKKWPQANVWWWAWEDFREDDELFSFLRSSPLSALRRTEPGRFAAGCPKQLLTHLPPDERIEAVTLSSSERLCSFMLYAVSGVPGPEFVPSSCALPPSEWPDPAQYLPWARSILARVPAIGDWGDAPCAPRESFGLEREVLVASKMLPRLASRAGRRAQVYPLGRALEQLLRNSQRLLNTPAYHQALHAGDPHTGDPHVQHVFSSIYRSVEGVLTLVSSTVVD